MGTKVRLTRSGGFAGLSLVALVDLDDLPEETAEKYGPPSTEVDFDPPRRRSGAARMPGAADTYQYDLEVTTARSAR